MRHPKQRRPANGSQRCPCDHCLFRCRRSSPAHIAPRERGVFGIENPKGPAQQLTIALEPPDLVIAAVARMKPASLIEAYVRLVILQDLIRARVVAVFFMRIWSVGPPVSSCASPVTISFNGSPSSNVALSKFPSYSMRNLIRRPAPLDAKSEAFPTRGQLRIKGDCVVQQREACKAEHRNLPHRAASDSR